MLSESIEPETHSGIGLEAGASAEAIRQMMFNFYCGLPGHFIFNEPAAGLANSRVLPRWRKAMAGRVFKYEARVDLTV